MSVYAESYVEKKNNSAKVDVNLVSTVLENDDLVIVLTLNTFDSFFDTDQRSSLPIHILKELQ